MLHSNFFFDTKHFLDISPTFTSSVKDKVPGRYYDFLHLFKCPDVNHQDHLVCQVKGPTETFLWQLEGSAIITYGNGEKVFLRARLYEPIDMIVIIEASVIAIIHIQ